EAFAQGTVRPHICGQYAFFAFRGLKYGGSSTVDKQDTGCAICVVDDAAQRFSADYKYVFGFSSADKAVSHINAVYKSRASGGQIKGQRSGGTELPLYHAGN